MSTVNSTQPRTPVRYPPSTFVFLCLLAVLAAALAWLRLFYRPLPPSTTTASLPVLPKIARPILPENAVSPLVLNQLQLIPSQKTPLPETATLFSASPSASFEAIAKKVALKLKLAKSSSAPPEDLWKNASATLIANPKDLLLTYFLTQPLVSYGSSPEFSTATSSAAVFLKDLGLWHSALALNPQATLSLAASGQNLIPAKKDQAPDVLQLSYQYFVENKPIITGAQVDAIKLQVGHNQSVVGFVAFPLALSLTKLSAYPLVSQDRVLPLLKNGSARLLTVSPEEPGTSPFSTTIDSVSFDTLTLAYYYSPSQGLLYPVFLLEGNGLFSDKTKARLTFILPAIDPTYYK